MDNIDDVEDIEIFQLVLVNIIIYRNNNLDMSSNQYHPILAPPSV
jgi:hypothetical protein